MVCFGPMLTSSLPQPSLKLTEDRQYMGMATTLKPIIHPKSIIHTETTLKPIIHPKPIIHNQPSLNREKSQPHTVLSLRNRPPMTFATNCLLALAFNFDDASSEIHVNCGNFTF